MLKIRSYISAPRADALSPCTISHLVLMKFCLHSKKNLFLHFPVVLHHKKQSNNEVLCKEPERRICFHLSVTVFSFFANLFYFVFTC